jgi:hypothetical protein
MTVTYAILPNVRHGCNLTWPAVRPPRLPACFTTCDDNAPATSYVLHDLVGICGLRYHVMVLSRHPDSTYPDGLFCLRKRGGSKRVQGIPRWPARQHALMHSKRTESQP